MNQLTAQHPQQQWQLLVNATILGGDRGAMPPITEQRIASMIEQAKPEEAWLRSIASLSLYARAGYEPAESDQAVEPFQTTEDITCSGKAAAVLDSILHGGYRPLLKSWCRAAADAKQVAPAEYLPELLDMMHSRDGKDSIHLLQTVVGERGSWLSNIAPQWQSHQPETTDDQHIWDMGDTEQRLSHLMKLRRSDAAQALELLRTSWDKESHEDRAAFISAIEVGLNPDDESFLEDALDDSRKPVRQHAARLLTMLPGSALRQRITARAKEAVSMSNGWRGRKINITLPEKLDAQLKRDGIEARKQGAMGERAVMLSSIVAATPLETWSDNEPDQWIHTAIKSEWSEALLLGWYTATHRQKHKAWARALIEHHLATLPLKQQAQWQEQLGAILPSIENDALIAIVTDQVRKHGISHTTPWLEALDHWPADLSKRVLDDAKTLFRKQGSNYDWGLRNWLHEQGMLKLDIAVADEAGKGWPSEADHWNDKLAEMVTRIEHGLKLRLIIHQEFSS